MDILHLAAPCRNVPVTSALDGMNTYHRYKELGRPLEYLAECWARGWSPDPVEKEQYDWACMEPVDDAREEPERAWQFILVALNTPICEPHLGVLAAGALEDLLCLHGPEFIERVEAEAVANPKFAHVLGGVWQSQMSEEIWERVQRVWDPRGWQ
ncbi:hypothetical protein H8N03_25830 [Ramlibacter sp. USB13]|uniref:DUF6869 domain-containing protein n=1 Tax=Ramlibacter cellulosilyticus TaxID=2764187 RepID=A0A923SDX7_9BURK|nr:hypothetical protein [Ramlibacter cellulosilyticus]MBC5786384.1 hypothetical protein [Ramlibacter cellulosilyticus]